MWLRSTNGLFILLPSSSHCHGFWRIIQSAKTTITRIIEQCHSHTSANIGSFQAHNSPDRVPILILNEGPNDYGMADYVIVSVGDINYLTDLVTSVFFMYFT